MTSPGNLHQDSAWNKKCGTYYTKYTEAGASIFDIEPRTGEYRPGSDYSNCNKMCPEVLHLTFPTLILACVVSYCCQECLPGAAGFLYYHGKICRGVVLPNSSVSFGIRVLEVEIV